MVGLLDAAGRPLPANAGRRARMAAAMRDLHRPQRPSALIGGPGSPPWDAADTTSQEMADWLPALTSPDAEGGFWRDRIVARIRDLVRNDGWASSGITRITDAVVGADLRLSAKPDYRALSAWAPALDAVWAKEFAAAAEAAWRGWAYDPGKWCDAARRHPIPELFRLAFRSHLVDGDALGVMVWRPGRVAPGRARYATALQLIDADRLSNPQNRMDDRTFRGGIEVDEDGAATAYHIRRAHLGDWWAGADTAIWDRVPRETDWGRAVVVHWFEADRIGQNRGAGGILRPVLSRARMLARYDQVELQAAVVNAIFSAYIESPFDSDLVQDALDPSAGLPAYQAARADYHAEKRLSLSGVRIPTLFPGEKINTVSAARPSGNFPDFQAAMLRNLAAGIGTSYEQLTQDWSQTNYSSARAALLEVWKTLSRRRAGFAAGFCAPIYAAVLEEAFEAGDLPLPAGAPEFMEARAEYARCRWIGPGRGWVDPVKEPEGALLKIAGALSTLDQEAAENGGLDLEELLDQRALEVRMFEERGLAVPPALLGAEPAARAGAGGEAPPRGAGQGGR